MPKTAGDRVSIERAKLRPASPFLHTPCACFMHPVFTRTSGGALGVKPATHELVRVRWHAQTTAQTTTTNVRRSGEDSGEDESGVASVAEYCTMMITFWESCLRLKSFAKSSVRAEAFSLISCLPRQSIGCTGGIHMHSVTNPISTQGPCAVTSGNLLTPRPRAPIDESSRASLTRLAQRSCDNRHL